MNRTIKIIDRALEVASVPVVYAVAPVLVAHHEKISYKKALKEVNKSVRNILNR